MPGCMLGSLGDLPKPVYLSDTVAAPEDDEVDSESFLFHSAALKKGY